MKCPKCSADMEKTTIAGQEIDRCTSCKGIWLDLVEHTELKAHAREFDIGDSNVGSQFNKIDRINCPVCANTQLTRMVDNDQPHIWFESCSSCGGRFFDAGEFRDISELTLVDWFKKFTAQERK